MEFASAVVPMAFMLLMLFGLVFAVFGLVELADGGGLRKRSAFTVLACGVSLVAFAFAMQACGQTPTAPTVINVTQTQTVTINPTLGGAQPSPSPGASDVKEVRVGIFGQVCPAGVTIPHNSERIIKVGCTASITATPRRADGTDACEPEGTCSASDVTWDVSASAPGVVEVSIPSINFNRDAKGIGPGRVEFRAKVKGVEGVLDVDVVP